MQDSAGMATKGHIDRQKHEVDITEHVLGGGVRTSSGGPDSRVQETDLGISAWPLGTVATAVQVELVTDDEEGAR